MKQRYGNIFLFFLGLMIPAAATFSQDKNILYATSEIDNRLLNEPFEVLGLRGIRYENDFTKRATLFFANEDKFKVKWKPAVDGGDAPNNSPRYEIAAYEFQKLFLNPDEYVVPPTAGRAISLEDYKKLDPEIKPTFSGLDEVFVVMQYWLNDVTHIGVYDEDRLKENAGYAKHMGNLNIFTYLVKHMDSNVGNFLISIYGSNMRVFSVDNSLAFGDKKSNRGTDWKDLRLKNLPEHTIARLRKLTPERIEQQLGVVAQFQESENGLIPMEPTGNLDRVRGVRRQGNVIQFGLTEREIDGVINRLANLLERVDSGKVKTFATTDDLRQGS